MPEILDNDIFGYTATLSTLKPVNVQEGKKDWVGLLFQHFTRDTVNLLLVDIQKHAGFRRGGVILDFDNELQRHQRPPFADGRVGYLAWLRTILVEHLVEVLPGMHTPYKPDTIAPWETPPKEARREEFFDVSLLLTIYGAMSQDLPYSKKAHLIDDPEKPEHKLAVLGDKDYRSFREKVKERFANRHLFKDKEPRRIDPSETAAIGFRTIETYTKSIEKKRLRVSEERVTNVRDTMLFADGLEPAPHLSAEDAEVFLRKDAILDKFESTARAYYEVNRGILNPVHRIPDKPYPF
jgi:hypothetical protein